MKLRFSRIDDLVTYVERIHVERHSRTRSWTAGQIFFHLAAAFEGSMHGLPPGYPAIVRFVIRPMRWFVTKLKLPPMLPIPSSALKELSPPEDVDFECEKSRLLDAISEFERFTGDHPAHPVLGKLTRLEWIGFHLRHCEHHLSFIRCDSISES